MNFKTKILVAAAVLIAAPKFLKADEIRSAREHRTHTLSSVEKTNSCVGGQSKTVSADKMANSSRNSPENSPISGGSGPNPERQLPSFSLFLQNALWTEPKQTKNPHIQGKPADRGAGIGGPKPLLPKEKGGISKKGKTRQHLAEEKNRVYAKEREVREFYHRMV